MTSCRGRSGAASGKKGSFEMIKLWRSPDSWFGDEICPDGGVGGKEPDETITAMDAYTGEELEKIKKAGFNGIWVHGLLRHIVRVEPFKELGGESAKHIEALEKLISRSERRGLKVFIHMQPPRSLRADNDFFWNKHPDSGGVEDTAWDLHTRTDVRVRRLCTSSAEVKEWLKNGASEMARLLPSLGGITLITASEFGSHCYSRRMKKDPPRWSALIECPRCRGREPEDVVAELITLIRDGIREHSAGMEVIAWNWSWKWNPDSDSKIISQLPRDVVVMADFERGGRKNLLRRPNFFIDEYSLGYSGPSEKFLEVFNAARKRGMRCMSKLQLGTTHELASVVSLPILESLYRKAEFHKKEKVEGFMGCWNFGNVLPSANVAGFNYFLGGKCPDGRKEALESFAEVYMPGCDPGLAVKAWEIFSRAMYYYPFTIAFLYHGPQNHTLGYGEIYRPRELTEKPAGRSWKFDERGDDLSNSYLFHHTQFSLDDIIERLGKLAAAWNEGVEILRASTENCRGRQALDEFGNALICGRIWQSTENTFRVFKLRKDWDDSKKEEFFRIAEDELRILREVLPYVERDPRQGYHAEPHGYMFDAVKINKKISDLERIKNEGVKGD